MADVAPPPEGPGSSTDAAEEPSPSSPPETAEAPELSAQAAEMFDILDAELNDAIVEHAPAGRELVVRVRPDSWVRAGQVCRAALSCDYLSFVSGIDWMPRPSESDDDAGADTSAPVQPTGMTFGAAGSNGRYQVFARVCSTTKHWGVTLKSDLDEADPRIDSWVPVYPGADWHERECWEMFGFGFDGHPNLRHLYLPSDFEGHPLRKDFPLLAREVKPWPGLVDVEDMPGDHDESEGGADD